MPSCGGAPGSRESSSPCAAWGCAAPPSRPASPSHGRGSRCAGPPARGSSRHSWPRSDFRPPAPSAAGRRSQSSHATAPRQGSSPRARAGSSSRRSSVVPRIRLVFATRPYRRIIDDHSRSRSLATALLRARFASGFATAQLHHYRGPDPHTTLSTMRPPELSQGTAKSCPMGQNRL
jgi:hypothetical protein